MWRCIEAINIAFETGKATNKVITIHAKNDNIFDIS